MHSALAVKPSTLYLPQGCWDTIYDFLIFHFPHISAEQWRMRFLAGKVLDSTRTPLNVSSLYIPGQQIYYYRELPEEETIPFQEFILFEDEHIVVVDKPHFLPVIPSGKYVTQTLQHRLILATGCNDLQPIHRIDRHTSGLVVFSKEKHSRAAYQNLFRDSLVNKTYEAIAPALPHLTFPYVHKSRIEQGKAFFLSQESQGTPNSETLMSVIEKQHDLWKYRLHPVTGKKHQLRVHLNALGAPILNDAFYPVVNDVLGEDWTKPLQLQAKEISFIDPCTQMERYFVSTLRLQW